MRNRRRIGIVVIECALAMMLSSGFALAQAKSAAKNDPKQPATRKDDAYDVLFTRYLDSARQTSNDAGASYRWMAAMASDFRARDVNDLVTINVIENINASGTADSAVGKKNNGALAVTKLFGVETKLPGSMDPTNLVNGGVTTDYKGGGSTSRTGALTATMTARVVEVMPNGDMVLEGVREIEINGDRQLVVLTGTVRRADLAPDNSVLSTRVGQMRIRYFGNGLIKDSLNPGWLVRFLNKIF
jgi:flagellar L-ring protein precursor FlgH